MQPAPGGGEDGCKDQVSPPATGHRGCDRGGLSNSSPPFPSSEISSEEQKKHEHGDEQQQQQHPEANLQDPLAVIPKGPLIDIFSRVAYRSICRFKLVSHAWLTLCSDSEIRKRSLQALSGFFHTSIHDLNFLKFPGVGVPIDPSLPFLREIYKHIQVKQCCVSLLLCQCGNWKSSPEEEGCDYVVCNPATKIWIVLPPLVLPEQEGVELFDMYLGFDTAAPSRFVVFAPLSSFSHGFPEVAIYSSETGQWTSMQSEWGNDVNLIGFTEGVFLNGSMHWISNYSSVVAVNAEGNVWRNFNMPDITPNSYDDAFVSIGQSQGRLFACQVDLVYSQLYVWVLDDYDSGKWSLKHDVDGLELFRRHGGDNVTSYAVFAIHPECNVIFLTDRKKMTISYDLDYQEVHVISNSEEFFDGSAYTPCYWEWPSDAH